MSKVSDTVFRRFVDLSFLGLISIFGLTFTGMPVRAAEIAKIGAQLDSPVDSARPVNLSKNGPEIILVTPEEGGTYLSPIGIEIIFEPEKGTTVDLDTLKVTVVSKTAIGVFEIDITEDIADYASEKGINAPKAEIPAGDHVVTIQIADSERRMAEHHLSITVREESVLERRAKE